MEEYIFQEEIKVFGTRVKTFPTGISEVFESLIKMTGDASGARNYYGISEFKEGVMYYYAVAEEKLSGEAKKYNCEELKIESGLYLAISMHDWRKNLNCIKDIFSELLRDARVDKTKPAIEWYKDDDKMLCLIKTVNQIKETV
ncbi:MAG: hypothetical protein ABI358_10265 [Ginsengibacter sp.]